MLESLSFTLCIGSVLGFLAGIGVGGGSLLILWLTIVLDVSSDAARGINLLFFIPSALIVSFFRWRQGCLNWKVILPAVLSGCIAAGFFSWIRVILDTGYLRKAFGILLLLTGLREIFYMPQKKRSS